MLTMPYNMLPISVNYRTSLNNPVFWELQLELVIGPNPSQGLDIVVAWTKKLCGVDHSMFFLIEEERKKYSFLALKTYETFW